MGPRSKSVSEQSHISYSARSVRRRHSWPRRFHATFSAASPSSFPTPSRQRSKSTSTSGNSAPIHPRPARVLAGGGLARLGGHAENGLARRRRSRDRNGSREGHGRHARERIESRICSRINSRSESLRGEGQRLGATGDNDHVRMQDGFSLEKFAYG